MAQMQQNTGSTSLVNYSLIETRDSQDERLDKQLQYVTSMLDQTKSDREAVDVLTKNSSKGHSEHEDINMGLLCKILLERNNKESAKYLHWLMMISRDSMGIASHFLINLITNKFHRLHELSRLQCVYVTNQFIQANLTHAEPICCHLLRQILGGDLSEKNLNLCDRMLQMLSSNYAWLDLKVNLIPHVVSTFLRLLQDHLSEKLTNLRNREVLFVVRLLREKWDVCQQTMGRQLLRLLYALEQISEIKAIINDIINFPTSLSPNFSGGFLQLITTKISRKLISSRIPLELEKKIRFLLTSVSKKRAGIMQDFLYRQYLTSPESITLRADIIRFVCTCIHPTNEILGSDVTPRYMFISWLLNTQRSAQTCISLFWDWLAYVGDKGVIMDLEPFILTMFHSSRKQPALTISLVDCLCRRIREFPHKHQPVVSGHIQAVLELTLKLRVVATLQPIMESLRSNPEVVTLARTVFGRFFDGSMNVVPPSPTAEMAPVERSSSPTPPRSPLPVRSPATTPRLPISKPPHQPTPSSLVSDVTMNDVVIVEDHVTSQPTAVDDSSVAALLDPDDAGAAADGSDDVEGDGDGRAICSPPSALFSDEDDLNDSDESASSSPRKQRSEEKHRISSSSSSSSSIDDEGSDEAGAVQKSRDFKTALKRLDAVYEDLFKDCLKKSDPKEHCDQLKKIFNHCLETFEDWDGEKIQAFSACLVHVNKKCQFTLNFDVDKEYLNECLETPLMVIYKFVWENKKEENVLQNMLNLLSDMYIQDSRIGPFLLFYLATVASKTSEAHNLYKSFARRTKIGDFFACLGMDLKLCQDNDVNMLFYITPFIFRTFSEMWSTNNDIFQIIVAALDPLRLEDLQYQIMMGEFVMMNKDTVVSLLETSLEWESFEQYATWQLMSAHDIPFDLVLPLLHRLDPKAHAEALSSILTTLKLMRPTQEIVQHIVSRRCIDVDRFTVSLLRHWAIKHSKELAEHLSVVLSKSKPRQHAQPRKSLRPSRSQASKRQQASLASQPSTTDMLTHVDNLRKLPLPKSCEFFQQDSLIACLVHMQENFDEPCKSKFGDLFSIASRLQSDDDDISLSNMKSSMRKRSKTTASSRNQHVKQLSKAKYDDSGDSDDFEEATFPAKRKRRGRANPTNDSSESE